MYDNFIYEVQVEELTGAADYEIYCDTVKSLYSEEIMEVE